jgi:iron complex outermembrane recepter protein
MILRRADHPVAVLHAIDRQGYYEPCAGAEARSRRIWFMMGRPFRAEYLMPSGRPVKSLPHLRRNPLHGPWAGALPRLAILLAILLAAGAARAQAPLEAGATIQGRVTSQADGLPLAGATVRLSGTSTSAETDAGGRFELAVGPTRPVTIVVSQIGYLDQEVVIDAPGAGPLEVALDAAPTVGGEVVVMASRYEESILQSPVTVEKLGPGSLRETPAASFFDALNHVKGVDLGTQSLTFKSLNMRGFGANNNTRVVQLIDGMDNRSPGLGFSFGNVAGVSELDVQSIEVLPGASSALYGPDAINGILLVTTKDPYLFPGLSAQVRQGVNHFYNPDAEPSPLYDYAVRYAHAFDSGVAFKLNAAYLAGLDWYAADASERVANRAKVIDPERDTRDTNPAYDGVNVYGDENTILFGPEAGALDGVRVSRTGYREQDLADYQIASLRLNATAYYQLAPDVTASAAWSFGQGNTIQTAGARNYIPAYQRHQARAEVAGKHFFVRTYTTQLTADQTYNMTALANRLNQTASPNDVWAADYAAAYAGTAAGVRAGDHTAARAHADRGRLQPGTSAFDQTRDGITEMLALDGGARTIDSSDLYHTEGMYNFENLVSVGAGPTAVTLTDLVVGANWRRYALDSGGTVFLQRADGSEYSINEFGAYAQAAVSALEQRLRLVLASRWDKNQYFDAQLTPRASVVVNPVDRHFLRVSFQTGFRNPSPQNLLTDAPGSGFQQLGGAPAVVDRYDLRDNPGYTAASVQAYRNAGDAADTSPLQRYDVQELDTEKVRTWEAGYRGEAAQTVVWDAYVYYSEYRDFIGDQTIVQPDGMDGGAGDPADTFTDDTSWRLVIAQNNQDVIKVLGWAAGADVALPRDFVLSGNLAYNRLQEFESPTDNLSFFNTPKYRTNLTLAHREVIENLGFAVTWRWQNRTYWEQAFGQTYIPGFHYVDAQVSYRIPQWSTIVKVGGSNVTNDYYRQGYALPAVGALYYVSLTYDELLD